VRNLKIFKRNPDKVRTDTGQPDGQTLADLETMSARLRTNGRTLSGAPRWVSWFTDIGRPLSAIVVMVLCAPGERHLALLAGWGPNLSWGMAGLLVMYAGIAAVVATVRPKGAPGKRTAVVGAILSLLLAMAAQPVSHYFVTGWMTADPRPPFWLVTVVSCVPPFVMGHLLHLAADPGTGAKPDTADLMSAMGNHGLSDTALRRAAYVREHAAGQPDTVSAPMSATANRASATFPTDGDTRYYGQPDMADALNSEPVTVPDTEADIPWDPGAASWSPDMADEPEGGHGVPVSGYGPDTRTAGHFMNGLGNTGFTASGPLTPDMTFLLPAGQRVSGYRDPAESTLMYPAASGETPESIRELADSVTRMANGGQPDSYPPGDTGQTMSTLPTPGRASISGSELSAWVRDLWTLDPDMTKADVRLAVRQRFPDIKADTVRKAVTRVEEAIRT
jgi:hypothetical protein